jgi:hypothetical protein
MSPLAPSLEELSRLEVTVRLQNAALTPSLDMRSLPSTSQVAVASAMTSGLYSLSLPHTQK